MSWSLLSFLGEPWFVVCWYSVGVAGAGFVLRDVRLNNTALKPAMKWAWPIVVLFFSVAGVALYLATARAPGIGKLTSEEQKREAHDRYEEKMWRRVNGAVIHCVAGDGLGIMTGMVIARAGGMSFWQEFWLEYLIGFVIGWLVFQRKSMTMMAESLPIQLALAFRAEFFSMLTVMGGMGAVMTFVTPMVATSQPKPLTCAFWGFGMLGLLVGFVFTYPMNWAIVKLGWKHGMGGMRGAERNRAESAISKWGLVIGTIVLGGAALFLPAWLTRLREVSRARGKTIVVAPEVQPGEALFAGLQSSLQRAIAGLRRGDRGEATTGMDGALRAAEAGAHSAPGSFYSVLEQVQDARLALQQGDETRAMTKLRAAVKVMRPAVNARPPVLDLSRYRGAAVIDPEGAIIGEVTGTSEYFLDLALGGWRDAWGFIDLGSVQHVKVDARMLAFGRPRSVGLELVMVPTRQNVSASR